MLLENDNEIYKAELRAGYILDVPLTTGEEETAADAAPEAATPAETESPTEEAPAEEKEADALAGSYEMYGIWAGMNSSTGMPGRDVQDINKYLGYECYPLFERTDTFMDETTSVMLGSFEMRHGLHIEEKELPPGQYGYRFQVTDVFGEYHYSDLVDLAWDGKEATFLLPEEEG